MKLYQTTIVLTTGGRSSLRLGELANQNNSNMAQGLATVAAHYK